MSTRHDIKLHGPGVRNDRISGPLFYEILHVVVEGTQRAVRLRFDGKSKARGTQPAWLRPASQFDLVTTGDLGPGVVRIETRPLSELLADSASRTLLLGDTEGGKTSLDLFEEGLEDALAGAADSDRFDEGLVETFSDLSRLFDQGVEGVEFINGRTIPVSPEGMDRVQRLRRETPPPQAVRVAGRVDAIRHSDRMFTLILESGTVLKGYADRLDPARLAALFGRPAIVSGTAIFRPSKAILRIDADQIESAAAEQLQIWAKIPRPVLGSLDLRSLRETQGPRTGINAIIGEWPGDESDQEIQAGLEHSERTTFGSRPLHRSLGRTC
jgi:hypothetical protein